MATIDGLVSAKWLAGNLERPDVKILDGTWIMPGKTVNLPDGYIPDAQLFDIDAVADLSSSMAHMLPSQTDFENAVSKMGIRPSDIVIIYDRFGVWSSPRVWWTFRMFGHQNAAILSGGLPAWIAQGHSVSEVPARDHAQSKYKAGPPLSGAADMAQVLEASNSQEQILDARPRGRFYGTVPEPRSGLRSGHIPDSLSLPYTDLTVPNGDLKPLNDLEALVSDLNIDLEGPIITTCGSGVTAAGLAFALHLLGAKHVRVYDGSWTEWGASNAPVSLKD